MKGSRSARKRCTLMRRSALSAAFGSRSPALQVDPDPPQLAFAWPSPSQFQRQQTCSERPDPGVAEQSNFAVGGTGVVTIGLFFVVAGVSVGSLEVVSSAESND